ncbi:MAG: hypothetical protein ACI4GY_08345 [Acutalibacteraceae bacterium]
MEHKIHVGFGFHVNCYHSYRGDTNDNLGFGSDIRIIRKILDILTDFNKKGIPVKGTWDSENFFSLEQILPQYAPDIIEKMKERTAKYGDEQIIMGYSNGALGAMNSEELEASIELAVENSQKSGLMDIFGKYEKIVRPQEVMFTPSQVSIYNKLGVKALCLYYSCVPFDAFRTIISPLPDELAFNPLTYTYKGESMTILPTYSNSDVCDAGCLRAWVKELRKKQESGEINHDIFIFINMDADSIFWESMNLPVVGSKIANTDGIHGLVEEISDLPYIVFNTPGGYLKDHKPLGEITFTQDTADGNFTGYASWSEKPYNRKIWTAVERARAMSKVNAKSDFDSPSFKDRVLLLSTTHFGLATPVLNIQREKKADELAQKIITSETDALKKTKKLTVYNITNSLFQCVQLKLNEKIESVSELVFKGKELKDFAVISMENGSVFAFFEFSELKDKYTLDVSLKEKKEAPMKLSFETKDLSLRFNVDGKIEKLVYNSKQIGKNNFLSSFITYGKKKYNFEKTSVHALECAGNAEGIRLAGEIHLPGEITKGTFAFDFFTVGFSSAVYVRTDVTYPYTPELTSISTENSSLGRFSDMNWVEAAAFEITPCLGNDTRVVKRNFMGDVSSFRTRSFVESDPKNKKIASFNHQLTGGFVGLTDGKDGLVLANSRQVLGSMAHCPMRLDEDGTVHMNMFGTYYGPQRHHWGRAKDQILATYTLVTPQGKSIAPSYNGNREISLIGMFGFSGEEPTDDKLAEINAFSDGAVVSAPQNSLVGAYNEDNVYFKEASADGIDESKLKNPIMTGLSGNLLKYITLGPKAIGHIVASQIKAGRVKKK